MQKETKRFKSITKFSMGSRQIFANSNIHSLYKDYGCHLYDAASNTIKNKLNTIQNSALRLATGALRCTNIKKLEVETDVPALQLHRHYLCFNYGLKILSNNKNPTRHCLTDHERFEQTKHKPFARRLHDIGKEYNININKIDNKCEFPKPPWIHPNLNIDISAHTRTKSESSIEELQQEGNKVIAKYKNTLNLYTDGSFANKENKTGIGIFSKNYSECKRIPDGMSIFTAEAYAIFLAIKHGLFKKVATTIFTDSLSCLTAIKHITTNHTIITRIINILYYSPLNITLC